MATGQSYFDPKGTKVRVLSGGGRGRAAELAKGPYVAETFPVTIEDSYVIVDA